MNLQPLYEVKSRLEYAAIAGTGLLAEDFRLKKAAEGLKPLAAASPVFGKIDAGLDALLTAPAEARAGLLLDTLALVDAVAYTQAVTGREGELEPLPAGSGSYQKISYGQIAPLLTALTTTGSGRIDVIQSAWEEHPEFFSDYRVLPVVVGDLADSYSEISELNVKILKQVGPAALPVLREGFDPAGNKAMARRAEVIAAVLGPDAAAWLKELLPQAKKDVRAAVITALGSDPDNAALLLELARTERGKGREAVLNALSAMEGDAVRDFWANELVKNPNSVSFLQESGADWAADLVAAGIQARLEDAMYVRRIVTRETKAELQNWCAALRGGKASPAMLDFWRWADGHYDDIRRLESVGNSDFRLTEHMGNRLIENLYAAGPGPLTQLCLELWERDRESPRWLEQAVISALMSRPAAEIYELFSPYVLTEEPSGDGERKKALSLALIRGLNKMIWSSSAGKYIFWQSSHDPAQPLDPRWIGRLTQIAFRPDAGHYYPFGGGDEMDGYDKAVADLANPNDPDQCAWMIPYLRARMVETGCWYSYSRWLIKFGGSPKGVLKQAMKKAKRAAYLYHVWELLSDASAILPAEEIAELCQEALDSGHFRSTGEDMFLAKQALPWTIERLRAGQPFPEWDQWWKMRK